jgi:hypothetical protein
MLRIDIFPVTIQMYLIYLITYYIYYDQVNEGTNLQQKVWIFLQQRRNQPLCVECAICSPRIGTFPC